MKITGGLFAIITGFFTAIVFQGGLFAQAVPTMHLAAAVKGVPDGTPVMLQASSIQGWTPPDVKVEKGIFNIAANIPQPDLFTLVIGSEPSSPRYQLFLDNEIVEIAIDVPNNSIQLLSGATPIAFSELMNSFGPQFDALSAVARQRQQVGSTGIYSDSLNKAWDKQLAKIETMIPPFLEKYPNTSVSAFLLNTVWQLFNNVSKMDSWIALTGPKAQKSIFGENLEQQMSAERLFGYGQQAPDFVQEDPEGKPVSLKDFRGKYVLVDFWASWCGPCRMENPNVVQAYQRYKNKNFTVLGISLDRDKPKWLQAIKDDNLTWPHVSDLKFWQNEVAKLYQVSSIPQNFLLDPEGRIIGKNLRGAALDEFLEKTLGANKP
jgi:peroxiredoxin